MSERTFISSVSESSYLKDVPDGRRYFAIPSDGREKSFDEVAQDILKVNRSMVSDALRVPDHMLRRPRDTSGDWPEDFAHENGNYECRCGHCGKSFHGYKRRLMCRACALKTHTSQKPSDALMRMVRVASATKPKSWATLLRHAKLNPRSRVRAYGLMQQSSPNSYHYVLTALGAEVKRILESGK